MTPTQTPVKTQDKAAKPARAGRSQSSEEAARPRQESRARAASYQVEVRLRPEFFDAAGAQALELLQDAGLNTARAARSARVYELKGPFNIGHVQQAARDLLCDPVTEEFRILSEPVPVLNGMNQWRVEVWLKGSVSDPVGESVQEGLVELGLPAAESVRCAQAYRISGKCGRNHIEKAVAKTLANPVVHRFTVSETHG